MLRIPLYSASFAVCRIEMVTADNDQTKDEKESNDMHCLGSLFECFRQWLQRLQLLSSLLLDIGNQSCNLLIRQTAQRSQHRIYLTE